MVWTAEQVGESGSFMVREVLTNFVEMFLEAQHGPNEINRLVGSFIILLSQWSI